jgi:hypothetical protein
VPIKGCPSILGAAVAPLPSTGSRRTCIPPGPAGPQGPAGPGGNGDGGTSLASLDELVGLPCNTDGANPGVVDIHISSPNQGSSIQMICKTDRTVDWSTITPSPTTMTTPPRPPTTMPPVPTTPQPTGRAAAGLTTVVAPPMTQPPEA